MTGRTCSSGSVNNFRGPSRPKGGNRSMAGARLSAACTISPALKLRCAGRRNAITVTARATRLQDGVRLEVVGDRLPPDRNPQIDPRAGMFLVAHRRGRSDATRFPVAGGDQLLPFARLPAALA